MNDEIKNKIIDLYINEKLAAEGISKQLKKEGIHLSRSPIGKFLTKEKNAGRVKQIAQEDYKGVKKYLKKVKNTESNEKRDVYNIIREVTYHDRKFGQKTRSIKRIKRKQVKEIPGKLVKAPRWAKYKILFRSSNTDSLKTFIPKQYQGIQYFKSKNEANDALNLRLKLTDTINKKKIKFLKTQNGTNSWGFQKGNYLGK